jgi:FkbM family methyltransferase
VEAKLIYDFGMHDGSDTALYLAKGFRVVAVDAMPALCEHAGRRFASEVASGQLTVVNKAIVDRSGPVSFYANPLTAWGSVYEAWAQRSAQLGSPSVSLITVEGVTAAELFTEYGTPYYAKIDIEGADQLVLEGLRVCDTPPRYVSVESDKVSWQKVVADFDLLEQLGFRRFKVVPQHKVEEQVAPNPPLEGKYVDHRPAFGSSGFFGEEAPGQWLTRDQAIARYRKIFTRYRLLGDRISGKRDPVSVALQLLRKTVAADPGWYDTHATR